MNDIQNPIFGCVVPANELSSENMRYMASSVDTLELELEFASYMENGDALHSEFAESSTSSQGSNPFAEQATNRQVFPQARPAVVGTSSQGSDLLAEILKILATPEYDDLANQVANIYASSQKRPAVACVSFQGSDPPVRKKIKRTNDDDSSEAQQAQSKNADTACSKRVCIKIDGRKLNINGRIISLIPKEFVFLKLLIEKINTYVPTDDLYVAVYGDEAGDWNKSSKKERKCFYSLLGNLRMKLPEDCLEGDSWIGYMLSASVDMSSQGSDPSAQKRMKHTDDSNSFKAFESEEGGCNLQKIQYDSEDYSLIGNYYTDDYARFIEDNKSIRRRYTEVQKSPGFIRIGEVYISFSKNKVTFDGRNIILYLREIQALRFLALWYPDLVSYEQIYYNLSFGVKKIYVSVEIPAMKKRYITRLVGYVQTKLRSVTDGILISSSYGKGYSLVCYSNQQACPNESSVQDALHSQSTGSSS